MKSSKLKWILPLVIASMSLSGCDFLSNIPIIGGLFQSVSGGNDIDYASASREVKKYYKDVDIRNDTGEYLCEALHELMWKTHTNEIKYSQFETYCRASDTRKSIENVPGTNLNESFYSGVQVSGYKGNREHVWPAANSSGLWDHDKLDDKKVPYIGGGSDLYHVRMCNSSTNTLRGNSAFVDFDDFPNITGVKTINLSDSKYEGNSSAKAVKVTGGEEENGKLTFVNRIEVDDSMKGDVARIIAYLWIHYSSMPNTPSSKASKCGSLSLKSVIGYETPEKCQEVLCQWNKLDKPSAVEKQRNETVFKIQGNRNPFVDFPGLMDACFDL